MKVIVVPVPSTANWPAVGAGVAALTSGNAPSATIVEAALKPAPLTVYIPV